MSIFNNSRDNWIENPDDDIVRIKDPTQLETSSSDDEDPAVQDFKKREAAALQQPRNRMDINGVVSAAAGATMPAASEDKKRLSSAELLAAGAFGGGASNHRGSGSGGGGIGGCSISLTPIKQPSQQHQYNNLQDEGHDSDMSMSDSGRSDDDFASTSTNTRYVEEMLDDYRTINDLPHQEYTSLFTKVNHIRRDLPIGQNEEMARLLDCTYQLVIRRRDRTIRVEDFLKLMSHCFDKILTDNNVREWTESTHKSVWLLCALFIRLFATKLKFLEPSDPMMQSEYFFTAYLIFSEKINFHHYHLRSSSRYLPVHLDDPGLLENCTIYNHSSLQKGPGQHFKALLYVFAKFDGFDHLKKVIESRLVFNCEPENLDMLLKVGKFLSAVTTHLHVQFCSTSAAFAREIVKLLNEASDSQWMFKELKNLTESPLIELTLVNKELTAVLLNRQTIDRELIRRVDDVQLRFLLKTIQSAKLTGRTAAVEEMYKIFNMVAQLGDYLYRDIVLNISRTFDDLVQWFHENEVLSVLIRDNLHLVTFVEKIEKVLQVLIRRDAFQTSDLEMLWTSQWGKHDAVQRNMLLMISHLSRFMNLHLIDRLFELIRDSFKQTQSQRERSLLLDFCRNLISNQNSSQEIMQKAFELTWQLYHDNSLTMDIIEMLLNVRITIIHTARNPEILRHEGFLKCLEEIKTHSELSVPLFYHLKQCVIDSTDRRRRLNSKAMLTLINQENTISHLIDSIAEYLRKAREFILASGAPLPMENPDLCLLNSQFTHRFHVTQRLDALGFFILECADRNIFASVDDMRKLWHALIENPVCEFERQRGFNFFGQNMHCLSFDASFDIFNNCLLNFPPQHFTVNSFNEIASMLKYSKADALGRTVFNRSLANATMDEVINAIMQKIRDFLWHIILEGCDSVAHRAIEFSTCEMEDMADPERRNACAALFIDDCFLRLKGFEAAIKSTPENDGAAAKAQRIAKSLKVLLVRYENSIRNRAHPPLYRASMGRCFQVLLIFCKDDSKMKMPDARKILAVNSNWTMKYFYKQVLQMTSLERNRIISATTTTSAYKISDRMDLLSYHPSGGTSGTEAQVRVLTMLTSMKNERFPPLNSGVNTDTFRLIGRQSMRKTLGELHIDESTIFAARYAKSKRDTASFNFVSSMTQGDTPESSAVEESDDELEYSTDLINEMPEIILATNKERIFFLMDLADLAHKFSKSSLRDELANLLDHLTATDEICAEIEASLLQGTLYQTIITSSPTRTAFYFHVLHSLLTPVIFTEAYLKTEILFISTATVTPFFQFIETALTSSNGYFSVINARILLSFARMIKFASTCYRKIQFFNRGSTDSSTKDDETILEMKNDEDTYYNAFVLDILRMCFNNNCEIDRKALCQQAENYIVPMSILKSLMFVSWTASRCSINAVTCRNGPYSSSDDDDPMETSSTTSESSFTSSYLEDVIFAKMTDRSEAICETLTLEALDAFIEASQFCPDTPQLFYTPPYLLEGNLTFPDSSTSQPSFYEFIIDVMLHSSSELIRTKIARSIFSLLQAFPETAGEPGPRANALLDILFANLGNAEINWLRCLQYFECLYRLMDYCQKEEIQPNDSEAKFQQVIQWLQNAKAATHENGSTYQREELLVCYLKTASHLLRLMPRSFRETLGYQGINFLQDLFDDFLMPFSKAYHTLEADEIQSFVLNGAAPVSPANSDSSAAVMLKPNKAMPICRSDASVAAGFALIADIVRDVPHNLQQALEFILQNFYSDFIPTVTNDQPPPYLQRDSTVFVGLKNAGATCYMNSVIQQLFMIEPFRNAVLSAKCKIYERDLYSLNDKERKEKEYANQLIHSVQAMFAHVLASEEQFYTPVEFWDTFQFGGRDVNIREQQDAVEFFNALADGLDESLKKIGEQPVFEKLFGGTFADQKKCRDCPHMYEKEQLFTSIAVDIRSHNNLTASLNEYVTGDLLEGDNAYFCELCNAKVTAVKRLCIAKLPPFLMIQLKRFDMDWNRGDLATVKFFDYFEFPSVIDMEPFTSKGVAKRENGATAMDTSMMSSGVGGGGLVCSTTESNESTLYRLRGVVVHSGEAHGGHYYSYIADNKEDGKQQWYRFDDTDVVSWDYNETESRINWFGGYTDVAFPNDKDRRRFSAYMLVYEAIPTNEHLQQISCGTNRSISAHSPSPPFVPSPNVNTMDMRFGSMSLHSRRGTTNRLPYYWERIVTKNNLKFSHERFQYTQGYFKFIRDMTRFAALQCKEKMADTKLAKQAIQVFACFLFSTAIRCPNDFRAAQMREWQITIEMLFETSDVAKWFITNFLTKGNIIHCAILQPNSTLEMRKFMERLITIPTCICMSAADANGEDAPTADAGADFAADELIKKILQVSKSHTMDFWNNGFHVLHILISIASQSVQSARRLVSQNALYAMLVLLNHRDETRIRNFCRDNPHIFTFLGLLFTSCTSMKKPVKDSPILANPFSRPSKKAFFVPENAVLWFGTGSNVTRFFHLLIDSVLEIQQLLDLCCYLCWQSLPISFRLISILPLGANDASIKTTMILFKKLIEIDDMVQIERIKVACLGNEMSRIKGALVECATAAQMSQINRILPVLIEFLPMTKEIPKIKVALFGNPVFSNCLEKINVCLEKFIDPVGTASKASFNIGIRDYLPILSDIHESLKELMEEHQIFLTQNSTSASTLTSDGMADIPIEEAATAGIPEVEETIETTIGMFNTTYRQRTGGLDREVPRESDISSDSPYNLGRHIGNRAALSPLQTEYDEADDLTDDDEEEDDEELVAMDEACGDNDEGHTPLLRGKATPSPTLKAGKKRHFNPPAHGSQSSLPSYETIMSQPRSRKIRHEQSPHTSPVKLPPYSADALPKYSDCTRPLSPMQPTNNEYTGIYTSDDPPPA